VAGTPYDRLTEELYSTSRDLINDPYFDSAKDELPEHFQGLYQQSRAALIETYLH
jgi:hypothetical protein